MNEAAVFAGVAREYCTILETYQAASSWQFAHACLSILLRLYGSAMNLPDGPPGDLEYSVRATQEQWAAVVGRVQGNLAADGYWMVFEPLETSKPDPVYGVLSDDLGDVWRDVKEGLLLLELGTPDAEAQAHWSWRFSFETHWGQHAASAIVALHAVCYGAYSDPSRQ